MNVLFIPDKETGQYSRDSDSGRSDRSQGYNSPRGDNHHQDKLSPHGDNYHQDKLSPHGDNYHQEKHKSHSRSSSGSYEGVIRLLALLVYLK